MISNKAIKRNTKKVIFREWRYISLLVSIDLFLNIIIHFLYYIIKKNNIGYSLEIDLLLYILFIFLLRIINYFIQVSLFSLGHKKSLLIKDLIKYKKISLNLLKIGTLLSLIRAPFIFMNLLLIKFPEFNALFLNDNIDVIKIDKILLSLISFFFGLSIYIFILNPEKSAINNLKSSVICFTKNIKRFLSFELSFVGCFLLIFMSFVLMRSLIPLFITEFDYTINPVVFILEPYYGVSKMQLCEELYEDTFTI